MSLSEMERRHKTQVYPPRVKMSVALRSLHNHAVTVNYKLLMNILGSVDLLDTELMMSLGMIHALCIKFSKVILIPAPSIIYYRTTTDVAIASIKYKLVIQVSCTHDSTCNV